LGLYIAKSYVDLWIWAENNVDNGAVLKSFYKDLYEIEKEVQVPYQ
jgi:hypothetical protein